MPRIASAAVVCLVVLLIATPSLAGAWGHEADAQSSGRSITDNALTLPSADEVWRVVSLRDYNTRVVVLGVTVLGIAAGTVGTFMLLRRRALLADAVSHATLPGIALAFIAAVALGGEGRSLVALMLGAAITGVTGMLCVVAIGRLTRLHDDAALGIVLSVFFGLGVALLGLIQNMQQGNAAGLSQFIYGKAASMLGADALTILVAAAVIVAICAALFKEFAIVCFDQAYAAAQGWPIGWIDVVMMSLVVAVTVIGLQAVGLILIIALLIIPPAAARFWSDRLLPTVVLAATIGAISGYSGAIVSGLLPRAPTGPVIVIVAGAFFAASMIAGTRRGVVLQLLRRARSRRRVAMHHLLRAVYEHLEADDLAPNAHFALRDLQDHRSWSRSGLALVAGRAKRQHWIAPAGGNTWRLTAEGYRQAAKAVRNHRLWEAYLIEYADVAPSHVDRDADAIEHIIGEAMVERLMAVLNKQADEPTPPSPHALPSG